MTFYGQYTVPGVNKCVNFGVGQPSKNFLPLKLIKNANKKLLDEDDVDLLQYGDIPGFKNFRENLSKFLNNNYKSCFKNVNMEAINISPDDLFTTNANTQALSMVCSLLLKSGDTIFVEDPTYFLARNIFKNDFKLNVESISMEEDGLNIEELKSKLIPNQTNYLYTIPTFHNPTGITLSHEKRIELSKIENLVIIADEVYQFLYFDKAPPPPMAFYSENTISMGSFSKILAPSLRLGWIQSSPKFINILKNCGILDSSGGLNPYTAAIVNKIIETGELDDNIDFLKFELKTRCDALYDELSKNLSIKIRKPDGGYFIWFNLDKFIQPDNVKVHYGNKFSNNPNFSRYVRLSFSYYTPEDLVIGAKRLIDYYLNNMVVGIQGSRGRFGKLILDEIKDKFEVEIIEKDTQSFKSSIIIDVSSPEGTLNLIKKIQDFKIPLIIGTTGFNDISAIKNYSKSSPVALISNFTEGIPIIIEILKKYKLSNSTYSILESHHVNKKDSPSGTALTLKNSIITSESIPIESVRDGDIIGEHVVKIENELETIEIKHVSKDRKVFAKNVLNYIPFIINQHPGLYYSLNNNLQFEKYSGCGNDFIIVDNRKGSFNLKPEILCKRGKSIGSDGLILVNKSKHYDFEWTYYNADGNAVEMCGNGARCVAHYAYSNNIASKNMKFINNFGIITHATVNNSSVKILIKTEIEYLDLGEKTLQIKKYLNQYIDNIENILLLKIGVPHLIIILDIDLDGDINEYGKYINENILDYHANINFVNKNSESIRTYERGVNAETYACGTGCCAAMAALNKNKITFTVKSGEQVTTSYEEGNIYLEGPVENVYRVL
jgi:2-aminoadipate transaminase